MIRTIQERFGIDSEHTLSLVTSSFEVCRGNQIEIDESAYSLMCPALDEIIVVLEGKKLCACLLLNLSDRQFNKLIDKQFQPELTRKNKYL